MGDGDAEGQDVATRMSLVLCLLFEKPFRHDPAKELITSAPGLATSQPLLPLTYKDMTSLHILKLSLICRFTDETAITP